MSTSPRSRQPGEGHGQRGVMVVGRLAWSHLRFRSARFIALLCGMLLATTAFTVLTAASRTSQLRTVGTVTAHFVPATRSSCGPRAPGRSWKRRPIPSSPISCPASRRHPMAQYRQIRAIPGVQVAAPIAMVGYTLLNSPITYPLPAAEYGKPARPPALPLHHDMGQRRRHQPHHPALVLSLRDAQQLTPARAMRSVSPAAGPACPLPPQVQRGDPFGVAMQAGAACWSEATNGEPPFTEREPGPYDTDWVVPVLIGAIDPEAEASWTDSTR